MLNEPSDIIAFRTQLLAQIARQDGAVTWYGLRHVVGQFPHFADKLSVVLREMLNDDQISEVPNPDNTSMPYYRINQPHHPPTLSFAEAHLRPLRATDAGALFAYLSEPAVTELTSYPPVTMSLVESMIQKSQSRWAAGELAKWAIALRRDDQLIGTCGFNDFSAAHRWAELAYDLAPAHWGKCLMRQAASAAIDWAFAHGQVDRIQAFVRTDNVRSATLLERLGFVREGCLRSFRVCSGRAYDFYVYGLLRAEWAAKQDPSK